VWIQEIESAWGFILMVINMEEERKKLLDMLVEDLDGTIKSFQLVVRTTE